VVLARLEEDAIARPDDCDRFPAPLAEADALGDEDRLPERMGVPRRPSAGSEVDVGGARRDGPEGTATAST
jgi:hypothetical protein